MALAQQLQNAQVPAAPARIAADPPPTKRPRHYTVRRGDTLYAIAQRFDCSNVHELVRSNRLHSAGDLQIGTRLQLVGCRR